MDDQADPRGPEQEHMLTFFRIVAPTETSVQTHRADMVLASEKQKGQSEDWPKCLIRFGRGGGIRTRDPLHPMQVRYQAALRPDTSCAL